MKRYQKKKSKWNNPGALAVLTVVLILLCVLTVHTRSLRAADVDYAAKVQALSAEVEEESKRAEELEEYQVYVQTKQYIEQVAREKLGLVNPNESIVKPNE